MRDIASCTNTTFRNNCLYSIKKLINDPLINDHQIFLHLNNLRVALIHINQWSAKTKLMHRILFRKPSDPLNVPIGSGPEPGYIGYSF